MAAERGLISRSRSLTTLVPCASAALAPLLSSADTPMPSISASTRDHATVFLLGPQGGLHLCHVLFSVADDERLDDLADGDLTSFPRDTTLAALGWGELRSE